MNASDQRAHRTVTQALARDLQDAGVILERLMTQDQQLLAAGQELAGRVAVLAQQLTMLEEHYVGFRQRLLTPWQRLVWVIRG